MLVDQSEAQVKAIIRRGEQARSSLYKYAAGICEAVGLDPKMSLELGPVKDLKRIFQKAADKFDGDCLKVSDICRIRIKFDKPEQVEGIRKIFVAGKNSHPFHKKRKGDCEVLSFTDHFAQPKKHGFAAIDIKIAIPVKGCPVPCEVQIQHKDMGPTERASRKIYQKMRKLTDKEKAGFQLTSDEKTALEHYKRANIELWEGSVIEFGLQGLVNKNSNVFSFSQKSRETTAGKGPDAPTPL